MLKQDFLSLLTTEFDVNNYIINEKTVFEEIPDWDSMSILIVMSLVDENFGITLTAGDFGKIKTIEDLIIKIGASHFE